MTAIQYLYGTESGTAEMLCEDLAAEVEGDILSMEDCDPTQMNGDTFYVMVCSTFGSGDLPASAEPFFDAIQKQSPDLSAVNFAMFGLGDTIYADTFGHGSQKIMDALLERGAKLVGERMVFDVSSGKMPEDVGVPWLKTIMEQRG